jgi:SNF2 family DNA or RNA helicase
MSSVTLNIDEIRSEFIITGRTEKIIQNHRAKYYFLDFLKASFNSDGSISIPFPPTERELYLKKIQKSLEKYGIDQIDTPEIKKVLEHYYTEKEKFKIFSETAKRIWKNEVELSDFKSFKESLQINLPNRTLYDLQLLAAFHLAFSQNACNFSVPGAGKTSVVYGAFAYLNTLPKDHPKHINKLLIIGPLSSFGPWEDEFKECFGREVHSKRLSGGVTPDERERHLLSVEPLESIPELTLMSYQSVSFNLDNLKHFLQRSDIKAMVVLDEAHKIKNVEGGVWATSVLELRKLSGVNARVILTGTPVPNGYEDIYNLYEFIWPDKDIIDFNVYQLQDMSNNRIDSRIDRLIENISPFFIRIKKSDVLSPDKFPINNNDPFVVEMGQVQREIYDFIENRYIGYFEEQQDTAGISAELTKARFIRLMQAATNPALLRSPLENYFRDQGLSNDLYIDDRDIIGKILNYKEIEKVPVKFEAVKNLVTDLLSQNEKVIVWGTFIQNLHELQDFLKNSGINSELLYGATPTDTEDTPEHVFTREKIIRKFHEPNSHFKVIIANPFAVSESISLHKACHNAIYLERTFNASNFMQSKDRIHRVGLPVGVITNYHYIVSENSVDETIHSRLIEKERRMLELIESQEIPLISENLNYDIDLESDIKAIIRDYVRRTAKA